MVARDRIRLGRWRASVLHRRRANVSLDGKGHLAITARRERYTGPDGRTASFTSARMNTRAKFEFAYGRIEARIRVPRGRGLLPAFWAVGSDLDGVGWPEAGEIDIVEVYGSEPFTAHGTLHGPREGHAYFSIEASRDEDRSRTVPRVRRLLVPGQSSSSSTVRSTESDSPALPGGASWSFDTRSSSLHPRGRAALAGAARRHYTVAGDHAGRLGPGPFRSCHVLPDVRTRKLRPRCPRGTRMRPPDRRTRDDDADSVLLYHSVNDHAAAADRPWTVTPADFAAHMDAVMASGRTAMTITQIADGLRGTAPPGEAGWGYVRRRLFGHLWRASSLEERGLVATLYVTTGEVGGRDRLRRDSSRSSPGRARRDRRPQLSATGD